MTIENFVVKHYTSDAQPTIKGNGFDELKIGDDRWEAEEFVNWINEHIRPTMDGTKARKVLGANINSDGELCGGVTYIAENEDGTVHIDGHNISVKWLEALVWWMRNKK